MKTFKMFILLFMLGTVMAKAQNEKFNLALSKGTEMIKASARSEDFLNAANHFDRIAAVEKKEWLPLYYSSYSNLIAGILNQDVSKKDQLFDRAIELVDQADMLSPDNSEVYTLKGYAVFMKMSVDPQSRAMQMIGQANIALQKARDLNPDNPRPYLISGQNTFYTPEAFGGGKQNAKPLLQTALLKFENFKPENPLLPNWGAERCKSLLEECK